MIHASSMAAAVTADAVLLLWKVQLLLLLLLAVLGMLLTTGESRVC